jgi:hypothetical protein
VVEKHYSRNPTLHSEAMAKNRKYQPAAIRFGPAVKALALCMLIGGAGVGYVWQKGQIDDLGQQIRKRELRLDELKSLNEKLSKQLALMRSPPYLEARIQELNLGLAPARPAQVWSLPEPTPECARPPLSGRQLAQQAPEIRTP